jgi:hypothetical protein
LGIGDWKKLRPEIPIFAAPNAIPRLEKVCKVGVAPISQLQLEDPDVKISLAPGLGETTLFIESRKSDRPVVYVDELLEDLDRYPGPFVLRPLMLLIGKKPGFQVNRGFIRFFVKDKRTLASRILELVAGNSHAVFAHGPVRSSPEDLKKVRELLNSV